MGGLGRDDHRQSLGQVEVGGIVPRQHSLVRQRLAARVGQSYLREANGKCHGRIKDRQQVITAVLPWSH